MPAHGANSNPGGVRGLLDLLKDAGTTGKRHAGACANSARERTIHCLATAPCAPQQARTEKTAGASARSSASATIKSAPTMAFSSSCGPMVLYPRVCSSGCSSAAAVAAPLPARDQPPSACLPSPPLDHTARCSCAICVVTLLVPLVLLARWQSGTSASTWGGAAPGRFCDRLHPHSGSGW